MNWQLMITAHWPHDRFALGWEVLNPTTEVNWTTIQVFLFVFSIRLDIFPDEE